ncbi:MAG: hypothetical protein EPN97_15245 [Alphaproteobacteria bacterium]|nr:MAG: hypothetical protein EPN97_15245 [Alphaproteobacteria bacterium]
MGGVLFRLQSKRNPRIGAVIRLSLFGMAVVFATAPLFLPHFGIREPLIAYGLYGLASLDIGLAFVLPPVIEKQSISEYLFYEDRLEIKLQDRVYSLPYENIAGIEEAGTAQDAEHGLTAVRITTVTAAGIPFFGIGKTVLLPSLSTADLSLPRIKEVVEKSRRA